MIEFGSAYVVIYDWYIFINQKFMKRDDHFSIVFQFYLYSWPSELQDYIHRVGRTARAGRSGVAISLVNQYELEWFIQIEKLIGEEYMLCLFFDSLRNKSFLMNNW